MPQPPPPPIPSTQIPFYVDGVMDIQRRALFWARLAVWVSVLVCIVVLWATWNGHIPLYIAIPIFLTPILPIAAQTRIEELGTKTQDQIRDVLAEQNKPDRDE
jgi:hypothetical protein